MAQATGTVLCTAALRKIRAIDPSETPNTQELANCFEELKRMIETWGAIGQLVFTSTLDQFTLTSGTAEYTIGSGADIDTVRPIKILQGSFVTASGEDCQLTIISESRYLSFSNKTIGIPDTPKYIWYKPEYPSGKIYLLPAGGGVLNLYSLKPLAEPAAVGNDVVFPDHYQDAIVWNLACRIKLEFMGADPSPYQLAMADHTMTTIRNLNMINDPVEIFNEMCYMNQGYLKHFGTYDIDAG
jgi:hypothetical protein